DAERRKREVGCVSSLVLDQLLLGELPTAEETALTAHLAACRTCAGTYAALTAEHQQFMREAPVASLAADALARAAAFPARAGLWRWVTGSALVACAGAA